MELSELSSYQEASLFRSGLEEWQEGPQVRIGNFMRGR